LQGCTIKITPELLEETAEQLSSIKSLFFKDVRVSNLGDLLEKCSNLREFKFHSLQNSDIVCGFNFN
jgi:hypothetical protein